MKRQHTSGIQTNVNRLSVLPFNPTAMPVSSNNHLEDHDTEHDVSGDYDDINSDDQTIPESNRYKLRRDINPPPGVKFGIHLQHLISSHRGVDLKLYDEIIDLIQFHATTQDTNFSTNKLYHRKELTKTLSQLYNLHDLQPALHNVTLSDSSVVTVPVFNVKAVILSILHDHNRMNPSNFAPGYDIFTGTSTDPNHHHLNEIHTGMLWNTARNFYCQGTINAFPLALVCFYDKTHTDLYGSLSCAPFVMTFSFFNERARGSDAFYGVLGYIPNLTYGLGKSSIKDPRDKLQDEHNCLKLITDQIRELAVGFETNVLGRNVIIKPWIHIIAGDTSGHNNIIGQFNSSNSMYPYRDCTCCLSQMSDPIPQCNLITMSDFHAAKADNCLHNLSLHSIDNAFENVPFGDLVHGIFGCVPAEMLHVSGNGIMQYQLDVVNAIISSGTNKRDTLHRLDVLHQNLVKDASLQSERDMPRTSDRNGVTDGTKMSASERVGNLFLLLCAMHTETGKGLFATGCSESGITLQQMKDCLKLQLGFEQWVNDSNALPDIDRAQPLLADLIIRIKTSFPRSTGNQWCLPKIHSLSKMLHYMRNFGKAKNFSGQVGERVLKSIVKDHAQQTQRRVNVFASQCAEREFESFVIQYAYNDISNCFGEQYHLQQNASPEIVNARGKHVISLSACDHRGRGDCTVTWSDRTRGSTQTSVHELITHTLRTYAISNGWNLPFVVHGFTSAYINVESTDKAVLFHANPLVYGSERYHFCMVEFCDDGDAPQRTCPARIMSFIKFATEGFPTPERAKLNQEQESMSTGALDNNLYAIVHTSEEYLSWDELEMSFISSFCLGDLRSCVYVVNVESISDPLFVCPNYGKQGLHYLCCLPYRKWGKYFRKQLN